MTHGNNITTNRGHTLGFFTPVSTNNPRPCVSNKPCLTHPFRNKKDRSKNALIKTNFKFNCLGQDSNTTPSCFQLPTSMSQTMKKLSQKIQKIHFFTKNRQKVAFLLTISRKKLEFFS